MTETLGIETHRVAGQALSFRAAGNHERNDQRDFDGGYRQRQHQCSVRFADAVGHHLGMMHGGEHTGCHTAGNQHNGVPTVAELRRQQNRRGEQRRRDRPRRQGA